jgi:hypothetical protein
VLISPDRVAAPRVFIASRLQAWRDPEGMILAGHYSTGLANAATTKAARPKSPPVTAEPAPRYCDPANTP